jgi:hypothetical protein
MSIRTGTTILYTAPQYRYQSNAEDQHLISELREWLMTGKLSHTTPAHILAASPTIHKDLVEKLKVCRIETDSCEEGHHSESSQNHSSHANTSVLCLLAWHEPEYSLPLQEIEVEFGDDTTEASILDSGSQIIVI